MHDRIRRDERRQIPAVSKILDALGQSDLPRPFVVELVRRKLSQIRASSVAPEFESIVADIRRSLDECRASRLQSVINGTGIVIHTNFGRAPLSSEAMHALNEIGPAYSNLEYDLVKGERGGRGVYVETALALLCEAEAATVVNNCAAALLLIVQHFTRKAGRARPPGAPEVVISRGELVQIGGGFRISEIRRSERREIARGRRDEQDHARRLCARRWTRDRDDSESAPQQFFHERLRRIAFLE